MLKRILFIALTLLPAMAWAQLRLGTADIEAIRAEMPETAAMQTAIDEASKKYEAEFSNLREKFQKELTDYQALPADTPNSIKQRRAQEIQELNQKMQQFITDAQAELQQQKQILEAPVTQRINDAIRLVGAEGGFAMILDVKTPLYIQAEDVTHLVRAKLGIAAAPVF